ncbi:molybdopterin cofactor-binding domain-containing protein [Tateyamaria sp.]|uniref:xanthine dehydrogenase family protein molybdopterin-binding subunit n=1 Tax=Tateyamaria sp. TaxID=1929288 RepID=UPI0032A0E9AE
MGKLRTITRRSFMIGSAAIVGGVAFGTYAAKKPIPNPLLNDLADGEAGLTPYVKINADGITLITPRADKGQGAYSVQAYLIAEELDVDPSKVTLSPGMPDPAYYNALIAEEGVPFPAYDDSWLAATMRDLISVVPKFMGLQLTGGSSTTAEAFVKLRTAGAVARETLKEAAAQQTGTKRADLRTEDGQVILPDGTKIAYTALAETAAKIDPIEEVELRSPDQWRFLGKNIPRVDMIAKCTGTQTYGIDLKMDGMLHATVRANPGYGAPVKSVDDTAAKAMRGVHKIIPITNGIGVIADNTWRAFQAADALQIEWEAPDYPASTEGMFKVLGDSINDDTRDTRLRNEGDVEAALQDDDVIDAEYRLPHLAHAPLEPMNAVVLYTAEKLEIWTGTQIPGFVRTHAAELSGLSEEQVFVYAQTMGGSFGRRLEDMYVMQSVELAMAVPGTPVKMTWSREEDMSHDFPRPSALMRAQGKTVNGKVDTMSLDIAQPSLAASWFGRLLGPVPGPDATIVAGSWDQPFAIPNYRVTGYRAPEMVPISSWRSVGASGNGFLHNGFLDELIHAAGADPLQERLRLCEHDLSRKVLEKVGEMSNWDGPDLGENRGRGVAFTLSFGVPVAEVVEVTNTPDGIRIDNVFVAAEVGQVIDPRNFEAQVIGGVIWGLGHAMNCELTYADHMAEQTNFHDYEGMRLYQTPQIEVAALTNGDKLRGIGEPAVPPAAPALAGAIFAATGQRIRELPLNKSVDFI